MCVIIEIYKKCYDEELIINDNRIITYTNTQGLNQGRMQDFSGGGEPNSIILVILDIHQA